jgi:hypothetical protein
MTVVADRAVLVDMALMTLIVDVPIIVDMTLMLDDAEPARMLML